MAEKKKPENVIDRTGVSQDYWNEFHRLEHYVRDHKDKVCPWVEQGKLKKYTERFKSDEYEDVVNDKNYKRVGVLDKIVKEINTMGRNNKCDIPRVKLLLKRAYYLVHGKKEPEGDETKKSYCTEEREKEIHEYIKEKEKKEKEAAK
ncbi:hypothetical protein FJZ53_06755 [Candidatus Woesearchaeota archaeon]|nr:hypothetical protein [Candidatus Woesearchaeota archaeon]